MSNQPKTDSAPYTRRTFIKTGTVAVAGLALANRNFAGPKTETLAASGGAKAVTVPAQRQAALSHWPRYDEKETQAVSAVLDANKYYEELPLFEKEWKAYVGAPYVKLHHNGTSALSSSDAEQTSRVGRPRRRRSATASNASSRCAGISVIFLIASVSV